MAEALGSVGGPIVSKSAADRIVKAPVLTPDEPDRERHEYPEGNIRKVAQSFLPSGEIDAMHAGGEVGYPTENYIAPQQLEFGDRTVSAGTWMIAVKVTDDAVWQGVESGEYTGVSVFGPIARVLDGDGNELDIQEIARPVGQGGGAGAQSQPAVANSFAGGGPSLELPPAPVGETWTVELERATHVSIVDDPAVQAASFVVAKSAGSGASGNGSGEITMDQELEERLDDIEASIKKSAEAAAEDAAETAAEEAVENADVGGDGGDGGDNGGSDDLSEDDVRSIVGDEVGNALEDADLGGDGGDGGDGGSDGLDIDGDVDAETVETLVDAGVIDEETAEELGTEETGIEKRLAAIEKSLQDGGGRQGFGTQLDGLGDEDGDESGTDLVSNGDRAAAVKRAGTAGGQGGDDE